MNVFVSAFRKVRLGDSHPGPGDYAIVGVSAGVGIAFCIALAGLVLLGPPAVVGFVFGETVGILFGIMWAFGVVGGLIGLMLWWEER